MIGEFEGHEWALPEVGPGGIGMGLSKDKPGSASRQETETSWNKDCVIQDDCSPGLFKLFPSSGNQSLLVGVQDEIRRLQRRIVSVQEEERRRISRELHDEAGQLLTTSIFKLDLCTAKVSAEHPAVSAVLKEVREVLTACAERIHALSLDLRPPMLEDLGLVPTIGWYFRHFMEKESIIVDLRANVQEEALPVEVRTAAFRVVQEALTNVIKHASATRIKVRLCGGDDCLALAVRDNGKGFDFERTRQELLGNPSLGIVGMRERVESLSGKFRIFSKSGLGTLVYARFPLGLGE